MFSYLLLMTLLHTNSKQVLCSEYSLEAGKQIMNYETTTHKSAVIHNDQTASPTYEDNIQDSYEKSVIERVLKFYDSNNTESSSWINNSRKPFDSQNASGYFNPSELDSLINQQNDLNWKNIFQDSEKIDWNEINRNLNDMDQYKKNEEFLSKIRDLPNIEDMIITLPPLTTPKSNAINRLEIRLLLKVFALVIGLIIAALIVAIRSCKTKLCLSKKKNDGMRDELISFEKAQEV